MNSTAGAREAQDAEWYCQAYGPEPAKIGALCFLARELGQRVCGSPDECKAVMTAERQRIYRRVNELAACSDDPTWADLAETFGTPERILGGEEDKPPN